MIMVVVAGVGFERHGLQVMSLTSYLCSTPRYISKTAHKFILTYAQ